MSIGRSQTMNALQLAVYARAFGHQTGAGSRRDRAMAEARIQLEQAEKAARSARTTRSRPDRQAPQATPHAKTA
jgi:hypothetical protein